MTRLPTWSIPSATKGKQVVGRISIERRLLFPPHILAGMRFLSFGVEIAVGPVGCENMPSPTSRISRAVKGPKVSAHESGLLTSKHRSRARDRETEREKVGNCGAQVNGSRSLF